MNQSYSTRPTTASDNNQSAADIVSAIEALGTRHQTPCGTGHIVWRRWGAGTPVILMHGGAGAWSHWIRNIEALSKRHTVWAFDFPGFGESAPPPEPSIESMMLAVEQGMQALIPGDEPINLCAFSFGAGIATMIGARLKERLNNLVLTGSRLFANDGSSGHPPPVSWRKLADPDQRMNAHRRNLEVMMFGDPKNIDALAVYLQSQNAPALRVSARRWKPSSRDKLREYLPRVTPRGRITLIFGEHDHGVQGVLKNRDSALRDLPHVRLEIIENAGHWVQYEAAERFNAILLKVLAS